jgi:hypothetical protein
VGKRFSNSFIGFGMRCSTSKSPPNRTFEFGEVNSVTKLNWFFPQKLQKHQTSFLGEFEIMMRLARQVSEAATKSSVDPHTQFDLSRFEVRFIHYQ